MDDPDPAPDGRRNTVLVPLLRAADLKHRGLENILADLETRRTLWFLAGAGNEKAEKALRDRPDDG